MGTELREASRAVLQQVLRASNAKDKSERSAELLVLRDRIEALLLAMRVAALVAAGRSVTFVVQRGGVTRRVAVVRWVPCGVNQVVGERPI